MERRLTKREFMYKVKAGVDFRCEGDFDKTVLIESSVEKMALIYFTAVILFVVFIIICNSLIITIFFKNSSLQRNYSYWYITLLAFFDLCFALTIIPLHVLTTQYIIPLSYQVCDVYFFVGSFLGHFETWLLLTMSWDRYLRIKNLQTEDNGIRKKNTILTFLTIFLISVFGSSLAIMFPHEYQSLNNCVSIQPLRKNSEQPLATMTILGQVLTVTIIPIAIMSVINWRVIVILSKYMDAVVEEKSADEESGQKSIIKLEYSDGHLNKKVTRSSTPTLQDLRKGLTVSSWLMKTKREKYFLKLVMALQFVYFVTCIPTVISFVFVFHTPCDWCRQSVVFRNLCPWAWFLNQAIDPVVLFISNKEFRRGLRRIFSRK